MDDRKQDEDASEPQKGASDQAEAEPDLVLKPCIAEILRTKYCRTGLIMFVDKIILVPMGQAHRNKAYRLYLSDGEKSVQAVLTRLMHPFVWTGEVREGSYVRLDKYTLEFGKKLNGQGTTAYLAISDIDTVGFRHKYTQDWTHGHLGVLTELPEAKQGPPKKISELKGRKYHYTKDDGYAVYKDPSVDDDPLGFVSADCGSDPEDNASPEPPSEHVDKKRKTGSTPLGEMDPNQASTLTGNPKPPKAQPGPPKAKGICKISAPATLSEDTTFYNQLVLAHAKRCHERPVVHGRWCGCKICHPKNHLWGEPEASESNSVAATAEPSAPPPPPKGKKQAKSLHAATPSTSQAALVAFAVAEHLKPIRRPLELHTLASLRPSRYWRNKLGDYFGVVSWVDNKTVTRMMGRLKRDLRIVDPTLDRQVLLSVFVDPVHFTPAVGTVALFRNLRTHEWEGGSLNAYPKDCDGYDWFVPHPVHIEACDVAGMREWFDGWLEEHGEERRFDALEEMVKGQDTREIAPQCHKECMKPAPDAELVTGE